MRLFALALASAVAISAAANVSAQEVKLKLHHFLPAQATVPSKFLEPWARKVEAESGGRIKIDLFPSMQLGGKPPALIDQARDGVVDLVWTLPGYTPGRFPKTEVFELPFMPTNGEQTSRAFWEYFDKHLRDEYREYKIIATWVHGPGLLHVKGKGVRKLEDMKGLKLRGPTRVINQLLSTLGAVPIGMPVPAVPEALSKGVIDGTVIPWEVTKTLRVPELVNTHTQFSGDRALYTATFVLAMNRAKYESLADDLKAVIDANSGLEASGEAGRVMDAGDPPARQVAVDRNNDIVTLNEKETERWREAAKAVEQAWIAEMEARDIDAKALVQDARDLVAKYSTK
jgi:TRAP-type C4-dicarboxylate transport system substrate-binding protein